VCVFERGSWRKAKAEEEEEQTNSASRKKKKKQQREERGPRGIYGFVCVCVCKCGVLTNKQKCLLLDGGVRY
jgi:hypothetical protein